ncbi:hypothetical protein L9F63_026104, partial [Diploptera punctata]
YHLPASPNMEYKKKKNMSVLIYKHKPIVHCSISDHRHHRQLFLRLRTPDGSLDNYQQKKKLTVVKTAED